MIYDSYKLHNGVTIVKPKHNPTYTLDDLLTQMTTETSLTRSDGMAAITYLTEYLTNMLSQGGMVTIDGLGTFGVSLCTDGDVDESKISGFDVQLKRITFRPSRQLKHRVADRMNHERIGQSMRNTGTPRYSIQQRRQLLQQLLDGQQEFTAEDYRSLTQTSMVTAHRDIHMYLSEGIVRSRSIGHNKLYCKA